MSYTQFERPPASITDAHWRRDTSFGAVYDGAIQHPDGRVSTFVETVPTHAQFKDSAVVIGGGFTSSEQHYALVQRQLGLHGEHSVFAGHNKHEHYEIGHNADDIAETCRALALGGVKKVVLLGHSRGGPEVLEAHELIRERDIPTTVTDIVLAFPAQFIEHFPSELAKNAPKFVIEMTLGMFRNPARQLKFNIQAAKNIVSDTERTVKEGMYLLTHHTGTDMVDRLATIENRPRLHVVVGLHDGLIAGKAVLKSMQDKQHDSLTILRSGHIDLNTAPQVTDIIHSKVRGTTAA